MWKKFSAFLIGLTLLLAGNTTVFASGFAIIEQSVSGLGNAFAGGAASADDASTIFFNPAGMMLLDEGKQTVSGAHVIIPSAKFKAETATSIEYAPGMSNSLGTNNGGDGGQVALVPNLYYSQRLNDKFALGVGVSAPFGLVTKYDNDWVGRYHAIESDVMTINVNPAFAYQATDKLTIAAGFSIQYIDVTLSSMVDGGLVNANLASAGHPLAIGALAADPTNISNTANDIFVENTADDLGYGYNLGFLYQFSDATRIGFAYRSQIKHKVEGEVTSTLPASMTPLSALFATQDVSGSITLPASASLSLYHQVNDKLAIMGDVSWTEWSTFEKLVINFEGAGIAGQSTSPTTENWDDTWRYSIGANYQVSDKLLLRTGVAFDETPISDEYRTPRVPGEDRTWVAIGAGYEFSENIYLDFAYAHLFVSDSKMMKTATAGGEDASRGTVIGEFENQVDIASIQLSYKF